MLLTKKSFINKIQELENKIDELNNNINSILLLLTKDTKNLKLIQNTYTYKKRTISLEKTNISSKDIRQTVDEIINNSDTKLKDILKRYYNGEILNTTQLAFIVAYVFNKLKQNTNKYKNIMYYKNQKIKALDVLSKLVSMYSSSLTSAYRASKLLKHLEENNELYLIDVIIEKNAIIKNGNIVQGLKNILDYYSKQQNI